MTSTSGSGKKDLTQIIQDAPAMDAMQHSLAETILDYAEREDREGVALYCESMSTDGLARLLKDLMLMTPIVRAKLMQK